MWTDLYVTLAGLVGMIIVGWGLVDLRRSWPSQRGKRLAQTLVGFAVGLYFVSAPILVFVLDAPFGAVSGEQFAISVLLVLALIAWNVRQSRRSCRSDLTSGQESPRS